jgi:hypothetical protein
VGSRRFAFALLWHMFTRYPQKSIPDGTDAVQLFDALFAEVKRWVHEMPKFMQDQVRSVCRSD